MNGHDEYLELLAASIDFGLTEEEVARLKASVHADVLEPTPARVIAGRIAQLSAPIPLY